MNKNGNINKWAMKTRCNAYTMDTPMFSVWRSIEMGPSKLNNWKLTRKCTIDARTYSMTSGQRTAYTSISHFKLHLVYLYAGIAHYPLLVTCAPSSNEIAAKDRNVHSDEQPPMNRYNNKISNHWSGVSSIDVGTEMATTTTTNVTHTCTAFTNENVLVNRHVNERSGNTVLAKCIWCNIQNNKRKKKKQKRLPRDSRQPPNCVTIFSSSFVYERRERTQRLQP